MLLRWQEYGFQLPPWPHLLAPPHRKNTVLSVRSKQPPCRVNLGAGATARVRLAVLMPCEQMEAFRINVRIVLAPNGPKTTSSTSAAD